MESYATLLPNGSVGEWKTPDGVDILFPSQMVNIGGKDKLRESHVCCPNFGPDETGNGLPQHGLVRLCTTERGNPTAQNPAVQQSAAAQDAWGDGVSTHFLFDQPWPHEVKVTMMHSCDERGVLTLVHVLEVRSLHTTAIPISLAFHPYIATHGQPFLIRNRGTETSSEDFAWGEPQFVGRHIIDHSFIELAHGTLEIALDGYNDICQWSDDNRYVCFEPVYRNANGKAATLAAGATVKVVCRMWFTPKT